MDAAGNLGPFDQVFPGKISVLRNLLAKLEPDTGLKSLGKTLFKGGNAGRQQALFPDFSLDDRVCPVLDAVNDSVAAGMPGKGGKHER
jgi:hypothetical protein